VDALEDTSSLLGGLLVTTIGLAAFSRADTPPEKRRDENVLYAAVGRALSQWETVESACARICAFLIGTPTDELTISPALHSFGIVNSFPTRCEMISTAGKAYSISIQRSRTMKSG